MSRMEPELVVDTPRLSALRQATIDTLGVIYDPAMVSRLLGCIVGRIRAGTVGAGITYAELVRESGVPTWVGHPGVLGRLLALVSLQSYVDHAVLVSAVTRVRDDDVLPTEGFCQFLEELGLVGSRFDREGCLELWDYHWKHAVTKLDTGRVPG